ncbi:MAG: hypothetical protein M1444_00555 [Patescibacteria group bacterium]|nr:hypothetical protein [Patescibacteria group bacterium]
MKSSSEVKIEKFNTLVGELKIDIRDDNKWPMIFGQLLQNESLDEQYKDWNELLKYFLQREKVLGHCHKGSIYWSLGTIDLTNGNINEAINHLEKSSEEDKIKLRGEKRITASIGLLSVIKPLLHRFKDKKQKWQFDPGIKDLYELLNKDEKKKFAETLFEAHNNFSQGKVKIILDNFFLFVTHDRTREITKDTYNEVSNAVLFGSQETYYSQIFAMGSIVEAMLDELFLRNNQEVWRQFKNKKDIFSRICNNSKMNKKDYPMNLTLGEKIFVLRMMTIENICPITKESLLLLLIIEEYRDLIHPRRRLSFEFEANRYVASILLTSISRIAGDWWPENVKKIIEANYKLNS